MYDQNYSSRNIPAPRAKEVAIRARQQEKALALLNAEYKAEFKDADRKSGNFITWLMFGLLSIFGLN